MDIAGNTLLILLLILFLGLLIPELFRRFKMPWVTSLILVGAIMGPHGLNYIHSDETISFFGFLGLAFLMLMSGLSTNIEAISHTKRQIASLALFNGLLPFVFGFLAAWFFNYGIWTSLVVGTVFVSSSIAMVIPTIRSYAFRKEGEGEAMIAAVVVEDTLSLFLLAIILQSFSPITDLPLPQYFVALVISFLFLRRVIPLMARKFFESSLAGETSHESQLRFVIVLLIAVLIFFSFLGVHPIIAAFLAGMFLSRVVTSSQVRDKLHTIGYGLFVPVFFFIVGTEMDASLLIYSHKSVWFTLTLIVVFLLTKTMGGYFGGRINGMSSRSSLFFGVASLPQLTTTLAAAYAAASVGIINASVLTSITVLSIFTTVISPYLLRIFSKYLGAKPVEPNN